MIKNALVTPDDGSMKLVGLEWPAHLVTAVVPGHTGELFVGEERIIGTKSRRALVPDKSPSNLRSYPHFQILLDRMAPEPSIR